LQRVGLGLRPLAKTHLGVLPTASCAPR